MSIVAAFVEDPDSEKHRAKSSKIHEIGTKVAQRYSLNFLEADFKKKNGFQISTVMSRDAGMYRQDYCGCCYSMRGGYQAADGERAKGKGSRGG